MKKWFKQLLFKKSDVRQYLSLALNPDEIGERVVLTSGSKSVDVTHSHCILGQKPFVVGITRPIEPDLINGILTISATDGSKLSSLEVTRTKEVSVGNASMPVYEVRDITIHAIGKLHFNLLLLYFFLKKRNPVSITELKCFAASYLFPRKVSLVCTGTDNDFNCFPIDFQGLSHTEDFHFLSLRKSNQSLKTIARDKFYLVGSVSSSDVKTVYDLGRHHSSNPPTKDRYPFSFSTSSAGKVPVPDIMNHYTICEAREMIDLGSHVLIIGKIENCVIVRPAEKSLFHQHIIAAIAGKSDYVQLKERF